MVCCLVHTPILPSLKLDLFYFAPEALFTCSHAAYIMTVALAFRS